VYGSKNAFIGKLVINYDDGTQDVIVTDDTWQFTDKGAVVCADYQQGESYDARLEFDWNDTADTRWIACGVQAWPSSVKPTNGSLSGEKFELSAQSSPTAKVERTLTPVSVKEFPEGHFVYDFGQNMVGTVRIKLKGDAGTSIKLRYGEMCRADGTLYVANLRTAANTDTYTLKGDADGETFIPSFTSHGFRYVEITGNGYTLDSVADLIISIDGLVITNTIEETASFECSNDDINQLYGNIMWGQRGNSLLVYTDCPQRNERMGWTGDGQVFAKTAAYNMDVKSFMNKWLLDLRDGQLLYNKNGAVPDTAPLGGDNRSDGCAGWGDAAVIIPWEMYRAYGDISVLEDNYDMMKKWVEYQSRADRQNYGIRTVNGAEVPKQSDLATIPYIQVQQRRGDHLTYDESTPFILSATAYAARVSEILADTAEILGKADDAAKYRKRYENIKQAFNEAWVQEDGSIAYWGEMSKSNKDANGNVINQTYYSNADGSNATPSQTAYALAIDFGLIPQGKMARAAECFQKSIDEQDGKLSVGFLGISHLASALTKAGLTDTAFALLEQTENPSWLYSVKNGATTIWERWNSYIAETDTFGDVSMNSFNHYSYGAIGEWMFSDILGINADEAGYKSIILKPTLGGNLTYAKGSYDSAYGEIKSEWSIDNQTLTYKCTVPANTTATLYLPANNAENITESGNNIENAVGVTYKGTENGEAVFALESGSYEFVSTVNGNTNEAYWLTINTPSGVTGTAKINGEHTLLPTAVSAAAGTTVEIEAEDSSETLKFAKWSGDIESTDKEISVIMDSAKTIQANYSYTAPPTEDEKVVLNLTSDVSGASVKINGETYSLPCNIEYEKGTEIELEVIVPNGYKFVSWNGDNLGAASVTVLMNGNVTSKAVFNRVLTGEKTTINIANPEKISAHAVIGGDDYPLPVTNEEIAVEYLENITIVSDDENYAFAYWSGDIVSSNNPIKSELPENPNLSTHFAYIGGNGDSDTVTLSVTGDDGGVYINGKEYSLPYCGDFTKGDQIVMFAKAPDKKLFKSWTNDKLIGSAAILTLNDDFETGVEFEAAIKKEVDSTGKNVTSNNSLENSDWGKSKLTDGVTIGSGYTSNAFGSIDAVSDPPYFEIDLGADTEISRVVLYPRTDASALAAGYYQFPQDFKIEVKADGGEYTQVYSVVGASDKSEPYIIDFDAVSARYVKVTATKLSPNQVKNGGIRFQLAECEVYKNAGELQKIEKISITDDGITDKNNLRAEVMPENSDSKAVSWFILDENGLNGDAEIVDNRLIVLTTDSTASIGAYAEDNGGAFALRPLNKKEEPTPTEYTVTYYKNDGTIENEDAYTSYTYGVGLTLPIPQKDSYTFGGWYDNESCTGDAVEVISDTATGNKTYYAKWIKNTIHEYVDVLGKFSDEFTIEKTSDETGIKFVVSPKNGKQLSSMQLYSAIYKEDKSLKKVTAVKCDVNADGNIIISLSEPQLENGESYKLMLWDANQIPIIAAISSDMSDFFR
ncbi:MAG: family 78 glycoside hydrolase catalytic domain, partial [Clostridia bacterium]